MKFTLGGGIPGFQPKLLGGGGGSTGGSGMTGSSERGRSRFLLRNSFGNVGHRGLKNAQNNSPAGDPKQSGLTPFRKAFVAGDLELTVNSGPDKRYPSHNQVNNIKRASNAGWRELAGGVNTGKAAYSGNTKYVYDGSDYTRFKKLQAKNRNYNDSSFGGPARGKNSYMLVALGRVRH